MELDMQTIGLRIKNRRKELQLTQTNIKAATGISSGNISDIENGNRLPAASTLVNLAKILECSIDWILTGHSPLSENCIISDNGNAKETEFLKGFRKLPDEEQEELMEILNMKLRKIQKAKGAKATSSHLTDAGKSDMVG